MFSVILSHASDVFKTLLQPGFKEGNQERSSKNPLSLDLPEDDGMTMETLVKVLHFCPTQSTSEGESTKNIVPSDLVKLAILTDKYLCTSVIYFMCDSLIIGHITSADIKTMDCLTHVAYLTENASGFLTITAKLLKEFSIDELSLISSACLKGLHDLKV